MKRFSNILTVTFLSTFVLFSSCKNENTDVVISGEVTNLKSLTKVILHQQNFDRNVFVDSLRVSSKKHKFQFVVKGISEPTFYQLHFVGNKTSVVVLLVEPGENISLTIHAPNYSQYEVTGSVGSKKVKMLSNRLAKTNHALDSLDIQFSNTDVRSERERISKEYEAAIDSQRVFSRQFILQNLQSRASIMAVYQQFANGHFVFDRAEDIQLLRVIATQLKTSDPESDFTQGILKDIASQEKKVYNYQLSRMIDEAENDLPEIALPNIYGDTVRLSSLRGKVILLDFWSSENQSSLFENQELKGFYDIFKEKGFEIYQVSLDENRAAWVSKVESTTLPWINVCEFNPAGSIAARNYNITKIPSNYLINRKYEIVGKNLYGKELERKIREII